MNIILNENDKIENMIYEIRGKQVMLDSDLARLYKCANGTKDINKAVNRNKARFPENFVFQLTDEEYKDLRFQIGTSKIRGGRRYNPYVFTEQGVAMLAGILNSSIAIKMSVEIIDAFVKMRHYISNNLIEQKYINNLVIEDHNRLKELELSFNKLEEKRKLNEIYFNGQIYDAYSKIVDIFKESKNELIIIDSYADKCVLDIISRIDVNVILITKKNNLLNKMDLDKYNSQYNNLKVIFNDTFHDRYFILDRKILYHCGTSLNRIGYKTFSINLISDDKMKNNFISEIEKILKES